MVAAAVTAPVAMVARRDSRLEIGGVGTAWVLETRRVLCAIKLKLSEARRRARAVSASGMCRNRHCIASGVRATCRRCRQRRVDTAAGSLGKIYKLERSSLGSPFLNSKRVCRLPACTSHHRLATRRGSLDSHWRLLSHGQVGFAKSRVSIGRFRIFPEHIIFESLL